MLQRIQKHIHGWLAGIIVAIIGITFVFWSVENYEKSSNQGEVIAKVAGYKITMTDVDELYQQFKAAEERHLHQSLSIPQQQQLRAMALQRLVNGYALYHAAQKAGFQVGLQQIQQMIANEPEFQQGGRFSQQRFEEILAANSLTPPKFFAQMQQALTARQVYDGILNSSFVVRNEMENLYALIKQTRDFGYFLLPSSRFAASSQPTDQQINDYYQQHKTDFRTPERVKVAYIVLSPKALADEIKISDAEVSQYYQDHASDFKSKSGEAKTLAASKPDITKILQQQKVDDVLNEKSQKLSELTYTNPGTLSVAAETLALPLQSSDWISRDQNTGLFADPKLLTAIFSNDILQQGNNSEPIELSDGSVVVLRVSDHEITADKPLAAVKNDIVKILQQQMAQKQAGLQAYEMQKALQSGASAQNIASKYHVTWVPENKVSRDNQKVTRPILEAAFGLVPTPQQKQPVTTTLLPNGDYAIIQLSAIAAGDYKNANLNDSNHLSTSLINYWGQTDYQLYIQSVLANTKVKYLQKPWTATP